MFRTAITVASLIAASAFAPARVTRSNGALKMAFETVGVVPPTGFWDPLGLSKNADEETLTLYKKAELKHGRVAMLAVLGYVTAEFTRLPGTVDLVTPFSSIPNGVAALGVVPSFGWFQILASIGYWELIGWEQVEGSKAGDFGFGKSYYETNFKTETQKNEIQTKELQNGRLAMLAIAELITHDIAKPAGESLLTLHHF